MTVTPEQTRAHLDRLATLQAETAEAARKEVLERAPTARDALTALGATRSWLFGSVAWGTVHPESDVDIATEGLPSGAASEGVVQLQAIFRREVHLVRLERAPASLRTLVYEHGRPL